MAYGNSEGEPNYVAEADFDSSGKIDWKDLLVLARNYGKTCWLKHATKKKHVCSKIEKSEEKAILHSTSFHINKSLNINEDKSRLKSTI